MTTTQAPQLASFALLRELASTPHIKPVIAARVAQIAHAGWDIVPDRETARECQGAPAAMRILAERRDKGVRFFRRPDANYQSCSKMLAQIAEDMLVADASAIYLRAPQKPGSGLYGGDIAELALLDAATVEPGVDAYGKLTGYMQYLSEVPRRDFMAIAAGPPPCEPFRHYPAGKTIYLSMTRRRETPFGCSPLEQAIVRTDDGAYDLSATAEHLMQAASDRWVQACMTYLREALFGRILDGSGLEWKWDTETAT